MAGCITTGIVRCDAPFIVLFFVQQSVAVYPGQGRMKKSHSPFVRFLFRLLRPVTNIKSPLSIQPRNDDHFDTLKITSNTGVLVIARPAVINFELSGILRQAEAI